MNRTDTLPAPRWEHYFMRRGDECSEFWREYLAGQDRKILLILGAGFDPRMCLGLDMLLDAKASCVQECLLIKYDEGPDSPSNDYGKRVKSNLDTMATRLSGKGVTRGEANVLMLSPDGRRIGSREASKAIDDSIMERFDDIVVDISSMPRGIYFPILAKLLHLLETQPTEGVSRPSVNLHVLVAEQASVDEKIQEEGIDDDAAYMHGFSSDLVREATADRPKVWIPVLGEGKKEQLSRLYDLDPPDEICPVLPSPSRNPRRADNLVAEYRELLFDHLRVEPTNFIYASEWNPFEVCRQIYRTVVRYNDALKPLGGCRVVVSALSSKLLSVGALLAAHEAKRGKFMVGISHVETHGFRIRGPIDSLDDAELFTLWISGECYDA